MMTKWIKKDNVYVLVNDDFSSLLLHEEGYLDIMNMIKEDNCPSIFNFSKEKEEALMNVFLEIDLKYKNTGYEYLALVDAVTGEKLCDIHTSYSNKIVNLSNEMIQIINNAKEESISLIHNHPLETTFSVKDIAMSNEITSIKESIIINTNGEIYFLYIPNNVKINLETNEEVRMFKTYYDEKINQILHKDFGFNYKNAKHLAMKEIAKEMGCKYGFKTLV